MVFANPPSGTTRIEHGLTVTIEFSERLNPSVREKGVRMAPSLKEPLKISLRKEKLRVVFPPELADDQTYILTLSRDITDEHGNRLERTYQLAFSTGETISEGSISGTVFDGKGASTVYLYSVDGMSLDTLFLKPPDYYTQSDDSGRYDFSFLDPGSYQVLAFEGGSPPSPLVPSRMAYGVHWDVPVIIKEEALQVRNINMRLSPEPLPLKVLTAGMETRRMGSVRLTNPVSLGSQDTSVLIIVDTLAGRRIKPDFLFQYEDPSSEFRFRVSDLTPGEAYDLVLSGVRDLGDQVLSSFRRPIDVPQREADTLRIVRPEPNASVRLQPGMIPLQVQFSDAVSAGDFQDAVQVLDSSGAGLGATVEWTNPTRVKIMPEAGWMQEQDYQIRLPGYLLRSDAGIAMRDSVVWFKVRVGPVVGEGGLVGSLTGKYVEGSMVVVRTLEKPSISYSTAVNSRGSFEFQNIPAGYWLLSVYQDRDRNARYSRGRAVPFESAEPFYPFSDTLEVRANWTLEGLQMAYPGDSTKSDNR